jgi:DNA-binding MarR family transcriptional regulator
MHFLSFAVKRAHLRCVETLKPVAGLYGLTPARFDVLHVIRQRLGEATQACIRHVLGVSGTTISRMVQALEELGFVARERHWRDKRTKLVRLTDLGRASVDAMIENLVMSGHLDLAFEGCFAWPAPGAEPSVRILYKALRYFARKLADRSGHLHPGEPPPALDPPWLALAPECAPRLSIGV